MKEASGRELYFRLLSYVRPYAGVFALAHGYGLSGFATVFASGVLWAWAYERTGSLLPGMAAHALNNLGVATALALLLRD